jgi:hypothetical protein
VHIIALCLARGPQSLRKDATMNCNWSESDLLERGNDY